MRRTSLDVFALAGCLALAIAQPCWAASPPDRPIPTVKELERRIVAGSRDAIRTGTVELVYQTFVGGVSPTQYKASIWFSGDKYRLDQTGRNTNTEKWGSTARYVLNHGIVIEDPVPYVLVLMSHQDHKGTERLREEKGLYDPRYLGFTPGGLGLLAKYGHGMIIDRTDRSEPEITSVALGDITTWMMSYTTLNGLALTCWFAPDMGYRPIQIVGTRTTNGHLDEFRVRSELKKYANGGVWYPVRVESTHLIDNKPVDQDVVTVKSAEFNVEINPTTFTIAGLGLAPGRRVIDGTGDDEELMMWNGKALIPVSPVAAAPLPMHPAAKGASRTWLLLGNAAALCILGAVVLMRVLKRSS